MKIRILGGGWYGCSIALGLIRSGHEVELHEAEDRLFSGASGANPARLHLGFHYPRSGLTQAACQDHQVEFMERYGHLTRGVPVNLYAVASAESLVDYASYINAFRGRVDFIEINPVEFGLQNVEGAILTGERHIVVDDARTWFMAELEQAARFGQPKASVDDPKWDVTIDCTFCANDEEGIDRFEPCVTVLLQGSADRAVTIMDGPFGSIYPWNEERGLSSLTSAALTPIVKTARTWTEAKAILDKQDRQQLADRGQAMMSQMEQYWPECRDRYEIADYRLSIRAMPRSAADSRLVDVVRIGDRALRVRAGKIDAVFHAERMIREQISASRRFVAAKMVA